MSKYEGNDHYLDSETGILANKLGIRNEDELKDAEASLSAWRSFQLAENPIEGCFDIDHLKAIHKHLFCDVYEWAGELRNIDLSKENSYFANHAHILSAARSVFEKLADEGYLKALQGIAGTEEFREVLENAPAGVFDARSWAYWNLKCDRSPYPHLPTRQGLQPVRPP